MGCCFNSPHANRSYRDTTDLDGGVLPLRTFGRFRSGSVLVPDDIDGLPSTHLPEHLASDTERVLYEAEIDQGHAFRFCKFSSLCYFFPYCWVYMLATGISKFFQCFTCDAMCLWLRKEYSTRTWYRVYSNRIEVNYPTWRIPYGCFGCGSWNADNIRTHPFDRGAFGFRRVPACTLNHFLLFCTSVWWNGGTTEMPVQRVVMEPSF